MIPAESGRVAAVLVTYNRREKLSKGIAAIRASTRRPDVIVIVDNASTDGTGEYLQTLADDPDIELLTMDSNFGGAGGFAAGMEHAYRGGADFMWVMDDDCYPEATALERLLDEHDIVEGYLHDRVPFACSVVKYIDGNLCEMNEAVPTWDWPRYHVHGMNAIKVIECTFVSALFPRWTVEEFGLPLAEYFIWYDDKEFTKRITARSRPGIQVLDSYVVHDMGVNQGVNYGQINESNIWKFEHGIRNQSSFRLHYEGRWAWLTYVRRVIIGMRHGGVDRALRRRAIKALWAGRSFNPKPKFPSERP